jgi:hypothetical protein
VGAAICDTRTGPLACTPKSAEFPEADGVSFWSSMAKRKRKRKQQRRVRPIRTWQELLYGAIGAVICTGLLITMFNNACLMFVKIAFAIIRSVYAG